MLFIKHNAVMLRHCLFTFVVFFITALVVSHQSFKTEITEQLQQKLAPELTKAFQQHMFDGQYKLLVIDDINQQFSSFDNRSSLSVISDYALTTEALFLSHYNDSFFYNVFVHQQLGFSSLYIHWNYGLEPKTAKLTVNFQINWWLLISLSLGMSVLISFALSLLPKPESSNAKYWLQRLVTLHLEAEIAKPLSQQLESVSEQQHQWLDELVNGLLNDSHLLQQVDVQDLVNWFISNKHIHSELAQDECFNLANVSIEKFVAALRQSSIDFEQAYQLVSSPTTLSFNLSLFTVNANGVEIKLAKTPFFYYLWYAYLKVNDVQSGWLINPSVNHPDLQSAKNLLILMKNYHGHSKSINELENHGLRAKTLDQNRNKIKEAFIAQLGETLSESYLFDLLRDTRTGRFQYRIKLACEHIFLPAELNEMQNLANKTVGNS